VGDSSPSNPDNAIQVHSTVTLYRTAEVVEMQISNLTGAPIFWWHQCSPSTEMWTGRAWLGSENICTDDAPPTELPTGQTTLRVIYAGRPGWYRWLFVVSKDLRARPIAYRSNVYTVEQ
jgi:hypothetical protein